VSETGRARVARTTRTWIAFVISALLVLGGMAWITTKALGLERDRAQAQGDADHEERVRLALWRMDSALAPLIRRESARSHARYMDGDDDPSPDVVLRFVLDDDGHAQVRDHGGDPEVERRFRETVGYAVVDASVPSGELSAGDPVQRPAGWRDVEVATPRLARAHSSRGARARGPRGSGASLPGSANAATPTEIDPLSLEGQPRAQRPAPAPQQPAPQQVADVVEQNAIQQQALNDNEFLKRAISVQKQSASRYGSSLSNYGQTSVLEQANAAAQLDETPPPAAQPKTQSKTQERPPLELPPLVREQSPASEDPRPDPTPKPKANDRGKKKRRGTAAKDPEPIEPDRAAEEPAPVARVIDVSEGVMHPVWLGDRLLLARHAEADGVRFVEGAWIDVDVVRGELLSEIADLLPRARLDPVRGPAQDTQRLLATLPFRILPGPRAEPVLGSSLTFPLAAAWLSVLLAVLGAFLLLRGALALSERRGAFVSAVTHELRTPLTTFRMYTEMLSEGMVEDEGRRAQYLDTLRREAHRLDNLVQNVLAYARIEDDRGRAHVESFALGDWLDQVQPRLTERLSQADMELIADIDEETRATSIRADRTAAEQIVFNLVDNAAKYGVNDHDARVHLEASVTGDAVALRVRDHGPGIESVEHRRVFQPFAKAREHEAGTAPGVGLGLALCRRLADQLGGELVLEPTDEGACFRLTLPRG
jgi:signal transduction histidine kinase